MIWAILALLGVPLWLCALGILTAVVQNRKLRKRYGDIPVRVRRPGKKRWTRGHAIWVSDVFAWRGSPAAWNEELIQVSEASSRAADPEEHKKLHRLGDDPAVVTLALSGRHVPGIAGSPVTQGATRGQQTGRSPAEPRRTRVPIWSRTLSPDELHRTPNAVYETEGHRFESCRARSPGALRERYSRCGEHGGNSLGCCFD